VPPFKVYVPLAVDNPSSALDELLPASGGGLPIFPLGGTPAGGLPVSLLDVAETFEAASAVTEVVV